MSTTKAAGPSAKTPAPTAKVADVVANFRPTRRFRPADSKTCITSLDFDDSGELAIVARDDETLQIYNCKEGKHAKELKSQKYGAHLARFTHHAQSIVYASTKVDDTIRYLSTHDNSYIRYFRGHTAAVTSIAMSPSSDTFLSCSQDNTVKLWALGSSSPQGQLKLQAPYLCAFDPSASVFAVASPAAQSILMYDIRNYDKPPFATFDLQPFEQRYAPHSAGRGWNALAFSNDGKHLVLGTSGPGHYVLDAFSGDLKHFCLRAKPSSNNSSTNNSSSGNVTRCDPGDYGKPNIAVSRSQGDVSLSPDGRYLFGGTTGQDGLLVWDLHEQSSRTGVEGGILRPATELHGPSRTAVVGYNPRHNLIISGDRDLMFWLPDPDTLP